MIDGVSNDAHQPQPSGDSAPDVTPVCRSQAFKRADLYSLAARNLLRILWLMISKTKADHADRTAKSQSVSEMFSPKSRSVSETFSLSRYHHCFRKRYQISLRKAHRRLPAPRTPNLLPHTRHPRLVPSFHASVSYFRPHETRSVCSGDISRINYPLTTRRNLSICRIYLKARQT
jgi:hypothetical protein